VLRFLLGVCEAGFFPGVLYVMTLWFPFEYPAKMVGSFMIYSAIANAIGAPIGGMLLDLDGPLGLKGWQWVFMVTGIPAVLMGFVTLAYLDDRPESAHFLSAPIRTGGRNVDGRPRGGRLPWRRPRLVASVGTPEGFHLEGSLIVERI
jgi:MFS family permease